MTQTRTYVKVTWVAMLYNRPVVTADTWDNLVAGVDDYYGQGTGIQDPSNKKIGYIVDDSKYPDPNGYDGYFEYEVDDFNGGREIEKVLVFCVDFYPPTIYEKAIQKEALIELTNINLENE